MTTDESGQSEHRDYPRERSRHFLSSRMAKLTPKAQTDQESLKEQSSGEENGEHAVPEGDMARRRLAALKEMRHREWCQALQRKYEWLLARIEDSEVLDVDRKTSVRTMLTDIDRLIKQGELETAQNKIAAVEQLL